VKVFYRYLYRELLSVSLVTTAVLTFLFVSLNVFRDVFDLLMNQEVSYGIIAKLIGLLIPYVLTFTLPWGLLLAVLLIFGRLSQDQELLSLKSSGIGLAPIIAPVIWLSLIFSGVNFWINASLGPQSRQLFKEISAELLRSNPLAFFTADQVIDQFDGFRMFVQERSGNELRGVHIWQLDEQGRLLRTIEAERARIDPDLNNQRILLTLFKARQEERDPLHPEDLSRIRAGSRAAELPLEISLNSFFARFQQPKNIGGLTLGEIGQQLFTPAFLLQNPNMTPVLTEIQKRIAFSLSCFTFVLVGIPLALQTQRRETSIGVALSLGIVLTYYVIIILAEAFKARTSFYPELIIWIPNVIFQILGIVLLIRANAR
jgi:lipopolysaccharide export system permease protein